MTFIKYIKNKIENGDLKTIIPLWVVAFLLGVLFGWICKFIYFAVRG
jgi:hypothetical protein